MESPTSFDLNAAMGRWREALRASGTISNGALEELEGHLRDSVEALACGGLSKEEGFLVASRRLGGCRELAEEFGKVDRGAVWIERALWAVIGVLGFRLLNNVAHFVSLLVVAGTSWVVKDARILGTIGVVVFVAGLGGGGWWLWRQTRIVGRWEWLARLGRWAVERPAKATLAAGGGTVAWSGIHGLATSFVPWRFGPADFGTFTLISQAGFLVMWLVPILALGGLLGLRRKAAVAGS